jgi:uncharacterized protein YbgA (DUF1722 family)/uncharacterized protein YbbK (DUF523 family)
MSDSEIKQEMTKPVKVGLSACLAGQEVRYNGGHKQSSLCLKTLSQFFKFYTFCPEVSAGFGTPRPTMRLIGQPQQPTLAFSDDDGSDLTQQLVDGFQNQLSQVDDYDGYILIKNSPSCGLERVKVYQQNGHPHNDPGRGLYAAALREKYPLLPMEEEGRLHDAHLRENFILRVYAHYNFRHEVLAKPTPHNLLQFHSRYKYVLMAQSQTAYKQLGKMLSNLADVDLTRVLDAYFASFMKALAKPATRANHVNTMMHILGYLKKDVPSQARQKIVETIEHYRSGYVPLVTPLTLLSHYIEQTGSDYIRAQRYLAPYPEVLGLRNRI